MYINIRFSAQSLVTSQLWFSPTSLKARVHPKLTLGSDFLIMQKIVSLTIVVNVEKCLNVRFEGFLYVNTVLKR